MKITFNLMDITVTADVMSVPHRGRDGNNTIRDIMITETTAVADFWGFRVDSRNFTDLAFIKSALQYYISSYWRRSSKEGSKIEFKKEIILSEQFYKIRRLMFEAKHKDGRHSLHICYILGEEVKDEAYLDCHDVMQLDIAIGKVINLIKPNILEPVK